MLNEINHYDYKITFSSVGVEFYTYDFATEEIVTHLITKISELPEDETSCACKECQEITVYEVKCKISSNYDRLTKRIQMDWNDKIVGDNRAIGYSTKKEAESRKLQDLNTKLKKAQKSVNYYKNKIIELL